MDAFELTSISPARRYRVEGEIGRGGMGIVYDALDLELNRRVAIKVLRDVTADAETLAQFRTEAKVAARLEHPNIAPLYDVGADAQGRVLLVMKRVRGRTLSAAIADATWPLRSRLEAFLAVARAVAYAHQEGVIHRDLKPSNVMIGEAGDVHVMDWGLARIAHLPDASFHSIVGTPMYMSPEQAKGEPLDARTDVYSLGAMLYEIVAGAPPIAPGTSDEIVERVRRGSVQPLPPDAPAELRAIVAKAMAYWAPERYTGATQLGDDVRAYLEGRVGIAWRVPVVKRVARWLLRHPAVPIALVALAAVVFLWPEPDDPYSAPTHGFSGRLEEGDETLPTGEYFDVYEFDWDAGTQVTVILDSRDLDPYLMVRGPGDLSLDTDDTLEMGRSSRLNFDVETTGRCRIVATSFRPGETGAYRLRIWTRAP